MSFVGTGNTQNHWTGEQAKEYLLKYGWEKQKVESMTKREAISQAAQDLLQARIDFRLKEINKD